MLHHGNAMYLNPNTRNGGNKCIHDLDDRRVRQDTSHNRPIQQIDQCWHVEEEYHKTVYALRSSINSHKNPKNSMVNAIWLKNQLVSDPLLRLI